MKVLSFKKNSMTLELDLFEQEALFMPKSSEAVKRWRERTKARLVEAMGGKCVCCGYNRCNRALEFHHRNPNEKEFGIGNILSSVISWARIITEVKKCVLVCNNCHAEIHDGITIVPEGAVGFNTEYNEYCIGKEVEPCSVCGNLKPKHLNTCSRVCAAKKSGSVEWDGIDILRLKKEGKSNAEIGDMLGVTSCAVSKRLKRMKNPYPRKMNWNRCHGERPSVEVILEYLKTKTFKEIGIIYGVTGDAVRYWIQK